MPIEARLREQLLRLEKLCAQGKPSSLADFNCEIPELLLRLREQIQGTESQDQCPPTVTLPGNGETSTKQPDLFPTATFHRDGQVRVHDLDPSMASELQVPGFEILGELGRGGMGVVLRARDLELDRDVAIKVLRHASDGSSDSALRFVEEAHITGQLQHPGIAPIYRLGKLPDRSPFFAMKLIKGRTLAELLAEREEPSQDRPRFVKIFEQICQTLAYAHSRRVIHRDLKPLNVMVGAFGEVQVMDWGLAKVLAEKETVPARRDESTAETTDSSSIRTLRDKTSGILIETSTGSVLGTLAYMPQEQALGEVSRLDERCDVFSLGAVLCEILTGHPPYIANTTEAAFRMATAADLADAFKRLDACGADTELISLTKQSLAGKRDNRPRDAGVFAAGLSAYLESVEARLRQAELDKAKAEVKVREERRRRRLAIALGLALLLLVAAASGGLLWFRGQQTETERIASLAIGKAEQLRDQAAKVTVAGEIVAKPGVDILDQAEAAVREAEAAVAAWKQAQAAVQEAESAIAAGIAQESLRTQVATLRRDIDLGSRHTGVVYAQLVREKRLLQDLDDARMAKLVNAQRFLDSITPAKKYAEAFNRYGMTIQAGKGKDLGARIAAERPAIRESLILALDDWVYFDPSVSHLKEIANAVDKDQWRNRLRNTSDPAVLLALSAEAHQHLPSANGIFLLAVRLGSSKHGDEAIKLLRLARQHYPADFWIHFQLGNSFERDKSLTDAEAEEEVGCYRSALALRPLAAAVHYNLGIALMGRNKSDEAIAEYRLAIKSNPQFAEAHTNLGVTLAKELELDEAIAEYRLAIKIDPKLAQGHASLGNAFADKRQWDEAIAEYRLAIKIDPKYAKAHNNLGLALVNKHQWDEAITEYRLAIKIDPKYAEAHANLGIAFAEKSQWEDAVDEYRLAIKINPKLANVHTLLVAAQTENELEKAQALYLPTFGINPRDANVHNNLGLALANKFQWDEAIAEYRLAIKINPTYAAPHNNLGVALNNKCQWEDAIAEFRLAIEINPNNFGSHFNLGKSLAAKKQWEDAIAEYRLAMEIDPANAESHNFLGWALHQQGRWDEAIAEYRLAIQFDPKRGVAHNDLGLALAAKKQWEDAIVEYRLAIEIDPKNAWAHGNLAVALWQRGEFSEAREKMQCAADLFAPNSSEGKGCAASLRDIDRLITLESKLPNVLSDPGQSADNAERLELVEVCRLKRRFGTAAEIYSQAFKKDPKLVEDLKSSHRNKAAHFAALASSGVGNDAEALDTPARAKLREQAIGWLQTDLEAWKNLLGACQPEDRQLLVEILGDWRQDPDLFRLRDAKELEKLPSGEREAWHKLWGDVASLLEQASPNPAMDQAIALYQAGKSEEAASKFLDIIKLHPTNSLSHDWLAFIELNRGNPASALRFAETAVNLDRKVAQFQLNLGRAREGVGDPEGAIKAYKEALRLDAGSEYIIFALSRVERDRDLLVRLPAIVAGTADPKTPTEACTFAGLLAQHQRRYVAAVRLFEGAFTIEQKLADDLTAAHRFNAVTYAVRASQGEGNDAPTKLEDRTTLRSKALAWLRQDLSLIKTLAASSSATERKTASDKLSHWLRVTELTGIRDKDALSKLPLKEREAFAKFWSDVTSMLKATAGP